MFQLYKKRNFGELVSDTFEFLKLHGKNYFKNYFIINGPLLLLLVISLYFLTKVYFEGIFSTITIGDNNPNGLINHMFNNMWVFMGLGILLIITILLVSIVNYTYPVSYLKLVESRTETTTENILKIMKLKLGRTIIFFLASIVIFIPLLIILGFLMFLLVFIIIGIPLLFIFIPTIMSWMILSYYDYISTENGYFQSLGNAFEIIKKKFWPIVGSTVIMYIIVQVVVGIITFIPYSIFLASMFTDIDASNTDQTFTTMSVVLSAVMVISIILNYTLQNLIFVNQGIIYYSVKEEEENNSIKSDIDLIGKDGE